MKTVGGGLTRDVCVAADAICNRIKNVLAEMYFQAEETDILVEEMACGELEQVNAPRGLPVSGNGSWR